MYAVFTWIVIVKELTGTKPLFSKPDKTRKNWSVVQCWREHSSLVPSTWYKFVTVRGTEIAWFQSLLRCELHHKRKIYESSSSKSTTSNSDSISDIRMQGALWEIRVPKLQIRIWSRPQRSELTEDYFRLNRCKSTLFILTICPALPWFKRLTSHFAFLSPLTWQAYILTVTIRLNFDLWN